MKGTCFGMLHENLLNLCRKSLCHLHAWAPERLLGSQTWTRAHAWHPAVARDPIFLTFMCVGQWLRFPCARNHFSNINVDKLVTLPIAMRLTSCVAYWLSNWWHRLKIFVFNGSLKCAFVELFFLASRKVWNKRLDRHALLCSFYFSARFTNRNSM